MNNVKRNCNIHTALGRLPLLGLKESGVRFACGRKLSFEWQKRDNMTKRDGHFSSLCLNAVSEVVTRYLADYVSLIFLPNVK